MASLVPERRGSISETAAQRRYSRVYDPPALQQTSKGPAIRVENETNSAATANSDGKMLAPESSALGALCAKCGLFLLCVLGLASSLMGKASLLALSQTLGVVLLLVVMFSVYSAMFYTWGNFHHFSLELSVKKVCVVFGMCVCSDVLSRVLDSYANMSVFTTAQFDLVQVVLQGILIFMLFSSTVHKDGLNGMFTGLTSSFVGLTLLLNFITTCLLNQIIPAFILSHLTYTSLLMGLTLSLIGVRFPSLSYGAAYMSLIQQPSVRYSYARRRSARNSVSRRTSTTSMSSAVSSTQNRRTSLVSVSSYASGLPNLPGAGGVDVDFLSEAHGMIGDLLLKDPLSDTATQKLNKIKELLAPRISKSVSVTPRVLLSAGSQITDEHDYEGDISAAQSDISRASSATQKFRIANQNHYTPRRVSMGRRNTARFSTVTTSTGMPVQDSEPLDRVRSLALRDVKARISVQEKRQSVHKMGFLRERYDSDSTSLRSNLESPRPIIDSPLTRSPRTLGSPATSPKVSNSELALDSGSGSEARSKDSNTGAHEQDHPSPRRQPIASPPPSSPPFSPSFGEGQRSQLKLPSLKTDETSLGKIVEEEPRGNELEVPTTRKRSHTAPSIFMPSPASGQLEHTSAAAGGETEKPVDERRKSSPLKNSGPGVSGNEGDFRSSSTVALTTANQDAAPVLTSRHERPANGYCMFSRYKQMDTGFELSQYSQSSIEVLEGVAAWDFPIFELEAQAGDHILSHMAYVLFHEAGLMETFQIPQREFISYFRALEANYGSNVYHNKTHAADVLHATSYLMFEIVPEFSVEFSSSSDRVWKGRHRTRSSGGSVASAFSILEVFACYMAAAMHDFDHPGRTNAFLVATKSPLAVLYNDRSVLENHHAAASWDLLTSLPENNFLGNLDESELKRFRFLIIEAILATDLKLHFDILSEFRAKVDPDDGGGIDWVSEVDRILVMKAIIKMADINTPTKSFDLHRSWTKRITEEFYQQAEQEAELGLPPTIFMDRNTPEKLPAIQLSFIQHLVSPLFHAAAEAAIIPGILEDAESPSATPPNQPELPEGEEQNTSTAEADALKTAVAADEAAPVAAKEETLDFDIEDDAFALQEKEQPTKKLLSVILTNLRINYDAWESELPEKAAATEPEEGKKDADKDAEGTTGEEERGGGGGGAGDSGGSGGEGTTESGSTATGVMKSIPQVMINDSTAS